MMKKESSLIVLTICLCVLLIAIPLSNDFYTYAASVTGNYGSVPANPASVSGNYNPAPTNPASVSGNHGSAPASHVSVSGNHGSVPTSPVSVSGNHGSVPEDDDDSDSYYFTPETPAVTNNNTVTGSNGVDITSSLPGTTVTEFIHMAATTDENTLKTQLGLTPGQEFNLTAYESVRSQSPAAWDSIWAAFNLYCQDNHLSDADYSELLQIETSVIENGEKTLLSDDGVTTIRLVLQDTTKRYGHYGKAMAIRVGAGGVISYLPDLDTDPGTITIDSPLGKAAYLLVWY